MVVDVQGCDRRMKESGIEIRTMHWLLGAANLVIIAPRHAIRQEHRQREPSPLT